MAEKNNDYMIDVAKNSTYLNQSDEYRRSYAEWRADPDNDYGYQFVHDTREHSYIDGKGYVPHMAEVAESISLVKCCSLMGICMLIMFAIDLLWYVVSGAFFDTNGYYVYRSQLHTAQQVPLSYVLVCGTACIVRYLVPAIVYFKVTKLPGKVAFPRSKRRLDLLGHSIIIILLILIIGRTVNGLSAEIFSWFNVDALYSVVYFSFKPSTIAVAFFFNCIAIPIVQELLFRGVFLQSFRQFGDLFAVLSSSLIGAFCFYDFSYYWQVTIFFILLGVVTVRTGSIFTPIIMSFVSHSINFVLSYLTLMGIKHASLIEALVSTGIIGTSIVAYTALISERHKLLTVSQVKSELRMVKKVQLLISSTSVALWVTVSIIMSFIIMRLIK